MAQITQGIQSNPAAVIPIQNGRVIWNVVLDNEHISLDWQGERIVMARPGSGTTTVPAKEYVRDSGYNKGHFAYLGNRLFRIASSFTSSNLATVDASLATDITAGRLVEVSGGGIADVADLISDNIGNALTTGTDDLLFVPAATTTGVQSVGTPTGENLIAVTGTGTAPLVGATQRLINAVIDAESALQAADLDDKMVLVSTADENNIAIFDYNGQVIDSGKSLDDIESGIAAVGTDGLTIQGDGSTNNPLHATQIIFNSMPTVAQLETMQMPDKTRFLVRGDDTGSGGGVVPSGDIQQYTYVYRMDEVKLHPEGWSDHLKNMMTIDASWAIPIIASNDAAGRGKYAGIKVSIQVPDSLDPQMQNMLGLNVDINEPLPDSWWEDFKDVRSERGGYEASYLKPEGIYNFTFNDSVNSWAQVWRVDNDGMYRAGGS